MDYMIRATAADAQVRAFAVTSRGIAEYARKAHDLSPVATAALGRAMSAALRQSANSMLNSFFMVESPLIKFETPTL